jgi:hypothetical protein
MFHAGSGRRQLEQRPRARSPRVAAGTAVITHSSPGLSPESESPAAAADSVHQRGVHTYADYAKYGLVTILHIV